MDGDREMKESTLNALRHKQKLTQEQLQEIEDEWVFGSSVVIPGLLAYIEILRAA